MTDHAFAAAVEIKPGRKYLVTLETCDPAEGRLISEALHAEFPGALFAIVGGATGLAEAAADD